MSGENVTTIGCSRARINLEICEGSDRDFNMRLGTRGDTSEVDYRDLTGSVIEMQVRENYNTTATILTFSSANGSIYIPEQVGENVGRFFIKFRRPATNGLCPAHAPRMSVYDIYVTDAQGLRRNHIYGNLHIYPAVTR